MIRRRVGDEFWLITQNNHARLAGAFAGAFGNAHFATPDPADQVIAAVSRHDRGWRTHDDAPTLSPAKLPLDLFETPRAIEHPAWMESARLASDIDSYVGLLVTLHQLHLSALSVSANPPASFNVQQLRQQFDLNKFQHAMIERLERLRDTLGMHTDRPLRLGLADGWTDPAEEKLKFDFHLMRVMDLLSLAVCCQEPPDVSPGPLFYRPGGSSIKLQIVRTAPAALRVKPWPFKMSVLRAPLPYKAVPAKTYDTLAEFQSTYAAAADQQLMCELRST